jgi:hypothetical protein
MGVNVAFTTILGRAGPDPVILGSSQAVSVSDQNGLASIVPSDGSVGACDVFITVSAGTATAQLQMESVTAVVPSPHSHEKTPVVPSVPRFSPVAVTPAATPALLYAFPQGMASVDSSASNPIVDVPAVACPEAPPESSSVAGSGNLASPQCATTEKIKAKEPAKVPARVVRGVGIVARKKVAEPKKTQSSLVSFRHFPKDERSCQVLAGNGPLF